jgi:hypothetical protein
MAQTSLQSSQTKVPVIGVSAQTVTGNPETIVNALGYLTKGERAIAIDCATNGFVPAYNEPRCGGTVAGSTQNINGALAAAGAKAGAVELSKTLLKGVPVVGSILESVASLIALPFAHHKQAVATEQNTLCQLVPPINTFLHQIDDLLLTGQVDGQTAIAAMDQFAANWKAAAKAIYQESKGKCNAACAYYKYMLAAMGMRKLKIQSGAVLDAHGMNNVNLAGPNPPPIPAGSTGTFLSALAGVFQPAPKAAGSAMQNASVLSLAGFTGASQSKLAIALVVLVVFSFGVVVNLAIAKRSLK